MHEWNSAFRARAHSRILYAAAARDFVCLTYVKIPTIMMLQKDYMISDDVDVCRIFIRIIMVLFTQHSRIHRTLRIRTFYEYHWFTLWGYLDFINYFVVILSANARASLNICDVIIWYLLLMNRLKTYGQTQELNGASLSICLYNS